MNKKPFFYIWAAATVLCMAAIFVFSSFDAEASDAQSNFLARLLMGNVEFAWVLRNVAHFLAFAVLGFCVAHTLKFYLCDKTLTLLLVSLGFSSFYALTDEIHQYFVPGRAFQVSDWLIDTAGALLGIVIVLCYLRLKTKVDKEN